MVMCHFLSSADCQSYKIKGSSRLLGMPVLSSSSFFASVDTVMVTFYTLCPNSQALILGSKPYLLLWAEFFLRAFIADRFHQPIKRVLCRRS